MKIKVGNCLRGCDITNSDIWWYLWDFGGKFPTAQLQSQWNTRYCLGSLLSTLEGTRTDGLTGDRQLDGYSSVSLKDRDIYNIWLCQVQIRVPTLALKPRGDITRSPKQRYQWPTKKSYFLQKFV